MSIPPFYSKDDPHPKRAKFKKGRASFKLKEHRGDFDDDGGTIDDKKVSPRNAQELEELADQVLKGFDRMFVYYREEGDNIFERVMFYREDANTVTVVDEINGKIETTYPLWGNSLERYENEYIEIVP